MEISNERNKKYRGSRRGFISKFFHWFPEDSRMIPALRHLTEEEDVLENLRNAKKDWLDANMSFNYVDDQEIVDFYTYRILACQVRYEYFLRKAKEMGCKGDCLEGGA